MITLFKLFELIFVVVIIRSLFGMIKPLKNTRRNKDTPANSSQRFDEKECDISDADYEEL